MERVALDDVESVSNPGSDHDKRRVAAALGATDVSINHYRLAPGEAFASVMHAHEGEAELFYVLAGTATFHTPDGDVAVGPAEAVRFAPGEFQRGVNHSDGEVRALGIGPSTAGASTVRVARACRACGERDSLLFVPGEDRVLRCPDCGAESSPTD